MNATSESAKETIAAVATPPGRGGIGIVRVSGPQVPDVIESWLGCTLQPRRARLCALTDRDGQPLDEILALYFPAPGSYTGEDVLELHAHGNPLLLEQLLAVLDSFGVRRALPGEFTQRSFLNGRLDLAQAEAVADLIAAGSAQALRAARRSLAGVFSVKVKALHETLCEMRAEIEAALDFPEEDVPAPALEGWRNRLARIESDIVELQRTAERGRRLNDGLKIAIAGAPNVGKSSLLNALAGDERAIVSPHPGTTRDVLRETLNIDGQIVELCDLAGLRASDDEVEKEGINRALNVVAQADLVLWVDDSRNPEAGLPPELEAAAQVIRIHNKIDLNPDPIEQRPGRDESGEIWISALSGAGLEAVRAAIAAHGLPDGGEGDFSARRRHLEHLSRCSLEIAEAGIVLDNTNTLELAAERLRQAADELAALTGKVSSDALLGRIFSRFCIGK